MKKIIIYLSILSSIAACTCRPNFLRPVIVQQKCDPPKKSDQEANFEERGIEEYDYTSNGDLYKRGEFVVSLEESTIEKIKQELNENEKKPESKIKSNFIKAAKDSIEYILKLQSKAAKDSIELPKITFRECECNRFILIHIEGGINAPTDLPIIMSLRSLPGVKYVDYNFIGEATEVKKPNDEPNFFDLSNVTANSPKDIIIGVVDTGLDNELFHAKDLLKNIYFNPTPTNDCGLNLDDKYGYNYVGQVGLENVDTDNKPVDDNPIRHGSNISADILRTSSSLKVGNIKILPVKAFDKNGTGDLFSASCGIVYAANRGARIINASFGFKSSRPDNLAALKNAVEHAKNKNALIITSSGNDGCSLNTNYGHYPAMFHSDTLDNIIVVSSALKNREVVFVPVFANTNPYFVHIAARASTYNFLNVGLTNQEQYGTSYSTGIITGLAAAELSLNINQDYSTLRQNILNHSNVQSLPYLLPFIQNGRVFTIGL